MPVSTDQLQRAVEAEHGGKATLFYVAHVHDRFDGQRLWDGHVHVFDLDGHPKATRVYAGFGAIDGSDKRRFYAALHLGDIQSPVDAVRAAIRVEGRAKG